MKFIAVFLLVLLFLPMSFALYEEESNNLYISLVSVGIEEAVVEATGEAIIVDYVMPDVKSENDILYQMQIIFVMVAKAIPTTPITIIKVRVDADADPLFIASAPTMAAVYLDQDMITVDEFWGAVIMNDPELYDEVVEAEEGSSGCSCWFWLGLLLVITVVIRYGFMKKDYEADIAAVKKKFKK